MSPSTVIIQKNDHIARITLNRPADGNVINIELGQELEEACRQANQDDDVYVVIITGAGDTFCNGSELERSFIVSKRHPSLEEMGTQYNVASVVAGIEKPVIAALNGEALGQGLEIALACDIRIASSAARLGFPNVKLGILPMDGGTQRLPRLIGKGKSLELIFLAETIGAEEAEQIGLVSRVVPPASLSAEVDALAKSMANKAPIALRYIKEAVNKGLDLTLEQGLRLEADLYFLLHTTSDRTEGIKAFLEKRPPGFKGK
ncbi:MAG: enoyl-CoA hydratase-related protein [Dehalococcoidia bacterium]|nr:enoyl-CoA hydratase-related protein [Dehalococcoidia bacterium]